MVNTKDFSGIRIPMQYFAEVDSATDATVQNGDDQQNNNAQSQQQEEPNKNDKKYSDADLDRIIGQKFAAWKEKQQTELDEAKRLAEMNAQQKAEYERDKLQKELDVLKRQTVLNDMAKTARGMLKESDIAISDDLLSVLVSEDAEKTKSNVESFVDMFGKAVDAAVKVKLKGEPPKGGKKSSGNLTKDQIMNIKDPAERQDAIMNNLELFEN